MLVIGHVRILRRPMRLATRQEGICISNLVFFACYSSPSDFSKSALAAQKDNNAWVF